MPLPHSPEGAASILGRYKDEKHKLEKEVEDLERRVHDSEYEAEVEKEKAEAVQEELWKLEHTSKLERAKLEELHALHAAKGGDVHLTQEEVEKHGGWCREGVNCDRRWRCGPTRQA